MNLVIILIVFFIFIIINHSLTNNLLPFVERKIEAMTCNPNAQSKKSVCFNQKMEENRNSVSDIEYTTKKLLKKVSNLFSASEGNSKSIKKTETSIRNIKNSNEGRGIDNSEACAKHPEAC